MYSCLFKCLWLTWAHLRLMTSQTVLEAFFLSFSLSLSWGIWEVEPFTPRLRFFFFFFKWRLAWAYYFHSLGQDQSPVAQWAETTVAECSMTSCMRARFLIGSHTMPGQQHSQPIPTSLGQGCMQYGYVYAICTFGRMTGIFYKPLRYHRGGMDTE